MLSNEFFLSEHTKIDVGWGFAPDPTGGAYSTPLNPLVGFKGHFAAGGEWGRAQKDLERGIEEGRGKGEWEGRGKG